MIYDLTRFDDVRRLLTDAIPLCAASPDVAAGLRDLRAILGVRDRAARLAVEAYIEERGLLVAPRNPEAAAEDAGTEREETSQMEGPQPVGMPRKVLESIVAGNRAALGLPPQKRIKTPVNCPDCEGAGDLGCHGDCGRCGGTGEVAGDAT